jgi:hypothetical protein
MGIKIAPDAFQNVMSKFVQDMECVRYQDCLVSDDFQNIMCKLVQDMEYIKTYLDDLLILTKRIKQLQRPST